MTGKVVVEDVVYESAPSNLEGLSPSSDLAFRRLVFKRTEGLIQSEALLVEDGEILDQSQKEQTKNVSQSKRKGNKKRNQGKNLTSVGVLIKTFSGENFMIFFACIHFRTEQTSYESLS